MRLAAEPGIGSKQAALEEVVGGKVQGGVRRHADEGRPETLEQRRSALMPRDRQEGIGNPCTPNLLMEGPDRVCSLPIFQLTSA